MSVRTNEIIRAVAIGKSMMMFLLSITTSPGSLPNRGIFGNKRRIAPNPIRNIPASMRILAREYIFYLLYLIEMGYVNL